MVPGLAALALLRLLPRLLMRFAAGWRTGRLAQRELVGEAALLRHAAEFGHHLLHLAELLEELADVVARRAAAERNAAAATEVDDLRIAALLRGHRADDGLDLLVVVVGDLRLRLP